MIRVGVIDMLVEFILEGKSSVGIISCKTLTCIAKKSIF